jgi:YD repeat-containing protein
MENKQLNALGAFEDLELFNKDGNRVYEFSTGSKGNWIKSTYDSDGNELTYEDSNGDWCKFTYDSDGNELTYEDSDGEKRELAIPEFTMEQLVKKIGHNFKIKK